MLGEKIGEEAGRITGQRVLPSAGEGARIEVSFQTSGSLLGVKYNGTVTYVAEARRDAFFGEGHGVLMTDDGATITFIGNGIGRPLSGGKGVAWRGAVYYQTTAERLARLNNVVGVFEHESLADGTARSSVWEWR